MARNNEKQTIIHPLAAIEALNGYHNDVGVLLTVVQTAINLLTNESLDARKVADSVAPTLQAKMEAVRRWYEE